LLAARIRVQRHGITFQVSVSVVVIFVINAA
jgi:hypothetical protein